MPVNEQTIFGENSASGIIIISATSTKIGIIINTNEDIESKYKILKILKQGLRKRFT